MIQEIAKRLNRHLCHKDQPRPERLVFSKSGNILSILDDSDLILSVDTHLSANVARKRVMKELHTMGYRMQLARHKHHALGS
jgi:hypothetical protein